MALDTRDRRASAILVGLPWRGLLPLPDAAAEDQGDRQQAGGYYRGVLAAVPGYGQIPGLAFGPLALALAVAGPATWALAGGGASAMRAAGGSDADEAAVIGLATVTPATAQASTATREGG